MSYFAQLAAADRWRREMHEKLLAEGYEYLGHDSYLKVSPPDLRTSIRTFSPSGWCEECSVREYKEKHPLTWNLSLRRNDITGRTDT